MISKTRATRKWLKNSFKNVYGASYNAYCELHYMLPEARWYTAGIYGFWIADIEIENGDLDIMFYLKVCPYAEQEEEE